jgi:TrmH family RNA methyltransferase
MPTHTIRRLTSRQNALVTRARALARGGRAVLTHALLEGLTLVSEAVTAGWHLEVIAVTERALQDPAVESLLSRLPAECDCVLTSPSVMDAMSPVRTPSGTLAIARLPPDALDRLFERTPTLIVAAVDVQDAGNVGAIIRVAEAAGATGVAACGTSADPFGWKGLRGAMGSAFRLPVVRRVAGDALIAAARERALQTVAATFGAPSPEHVDLSKPTVLFVGSEGAGLPLPVVRACDVSVSVPMAQPVESLNVAVATAVILYEARRQRTMTGVRS